MKGSFRPWPTGWTPKTLGYGCGCRVYCHSFARFATARLHQPVTQGRGNRTNALTMAFKLIDMAEGASASSMPRTCYARSCEHEIRR
jgi:hypothetical protein